MEEKSEASLEEIEEYHFVANQTFKTEDEAYMFYNDYAKAKGFSIRNGKVWRSLYEVIWRELLCSCEGYRMSNTLIGRIGKGSPDHSLNVDVVHCWRSS
jgi:hypothetical protein